MTGILPILEAPPAEREKWFEAHEQERDAQAAAAWQRDQVQEQLLKAIEHILGEHLHAAIAEDHYAPATTEAYKADIRRFKTWCTEAGLSYLPATPETVAGFLIEAAGGPERLPPLRHLIRMQSAIGYLHRLAQLENPCSDVLVRATMRWLKAKYEEQKRLRSCNGTAPKTNGSGEHGSKPTQH